MRSFILSAVALVLISILGTNSTESSYFGHTGNNIRKRKSIEAQIKPQLSAYYPSPDEDGTFLLVNLGVPTKRRRTFSEDSVKFFLYTSDESGNEIVSEIRTEDNDPTWLKHFKLNAPLKILCHGYKSSPDKPFPAKMIKSVVDSVNVNVVVMGWDALGKSDFYMDAVNTLRYVGQKAASMVEFLFGYNLMRMDDVHFIGHNLGAHIGGIAGQLLKERIGSIGRITGLDPAGLKDCTSEKDRLDPSDADFVDAVHTDDGDHCGEKWLNPKNSSADPRGARERNWGYRGRVGHMDFYPDANKIKSWKSEALDTCGPCNSYRFLESQSRSNSKQGKDEGC